MMCAVIVAMVSDTDETIAEKGGAVDEISTWSEELKRALSLLSKDDYIDPLDKEYGVIIESGIRLRSVAFHLVGIICESCGGEGVKQYPSTATWHGGIGGQAFTTDTCDVCWGTGRSDRRGVDLRKTSSELERMSRRIAQLEKEVDEGKATEWDSGNKIAEQDVQCMKDIEDPAEWWVTATVSNQEEANEKIPALLEHTGLKKTVRIVNQSGPIDLTKVVQDDVYTINALNGDVYEGTNVDRDCSESIDLVELQGPSHDKYRMQILNDCAGYGVEVTTRD